MSVVRINGHEYDIRLFVFDKDGLMFESRQFWIELAQSRIRAICRKYQEIPEQVIAGWMRFVGSSLTKENGYLQVVDVDPLGILAVAPVPEEITASAAFFKEQLDLDWLSAKKMTEDIFATGDDLFDLVASLKPRPGFPAILRRLRAADIPYGVATSDTKERVQISLDLFDSYREALFTVTLDDVCRGKPNPDMLYLIQQKTGVPLQQIAMVGDSLVDVEMARNAGAIGIGIPEEEDMRRRMTGVADEIAASLEDIQIPGGR